jgi:hypothetical protein
MLSMPSVEGPDQGRLQENVYLGWMAFVLVLRLLLAIAVINALLMIFSPAIWHKTPWWFRSASGIPGDSFPRGCGALRVRMMGAILLLTVTALTYSILCRPQAKPSVYVVRIAPKPR